MGNYVLLFVLAAVGATASILHSARSSAIDADRELAAYTYKSVVAREAAETGLNLTVRRLVADTARWSVNPSVYGFTQSRYRTATFTTQVLANHSPGPMLDLCAIDTVDVISTGVPDADTSGTLNHRIEATYVRTCIETGVRHSARGFSFDTGWTGLLGSGDDSSGTVFKASGIRLLDHAEW